MQGLVWYHKLFSISTFVNIFFISVLFLLFLLIYNLSHGPKYKVKQFKSGCSTVPPYSLGPAVEEANNPFGDDGDYDEEKNPFADWEEPI